jgi:hypothetical protein
VSLLAITVRQPWCWSMFHATPAKDVENRSRVSQWRRAEGQVIAIHAGRAVSERGFDNEIYRESLAHAYSDIRHRLDIRAAIIGTVRCYDVHTAESGCCDSPWAEWTYRDAYGHTVRDDIAHLVIDDPRPVAPVPCRGALGLWTVPADVELELSGTVR